MSVVASRNLICYPQDHHIDPKIGSLQWPNTHVNEETRPDLFACVLVNNMFMLFCALFKYCLWKKEHTAICGTQWTFHTPHQRHTSLSLWLRSCSCCFCCFCQHGVQRFGQWLHVSRVNSDLPAVELRSPQEQPTGSWTQHHLQIQRQGSLCFCCFYCSYSSDGALFY